MVPHRWLLLLGLLLLGLAGCSGQSEAIMPALIAREFTIHRPKSAGATVHAAPSDTGRVLFTASSDTRFLPFREQDGWYQGFVRGEWRVIGWVRAEQWQATDEQFPTSTGQ